MGDIYKEELMKKYFTIFFILLFSLSLSVTAASAASKTVSFSTNNKEAGSIYWLLDMDGNYTFMEYAPGKYNKECLIEEGKEYKRGVIKQSMIVVKPNSNYYLKGFSDGQKDIKLTKGLYNVIQMNVGGLQYYDFFLSNKDSVYKYLTVSAYDDLVKEYIKSMYGTSSYKVLDSFWAYSVEKYPHIKVKFAKKADPTLKFPEKIKSKVAEGSIEKLVDQDRDYELSFKSSNTKCCTVDKETGLIRIKSEGISTISIILNPTDTVKGKTYKVRVEIIPAVPKITNASSKNGSVTVSWTKDKYASGYKIKIGDKTVTVNSPKTLTKTIKSLTKGKTYSIKIRSYKKSCGEYLYSSWSSVKKVKVK